MKCSGPMCAHCDDLLPRLRLMAGPDGDSGWCDGCTLLAPLSSHSISPSDLTVCIVESPLVTLCRPPHADALCVVLCAAAALSELECDVQSVRMPQLLPMGQVWTASMHQNHENRNPSFAELTAGHGSLPDGALLRPRSIQAGSC